jgi:hypothetical protein
MCTFLLYKPQAVTNYARTNFFKGIVQQILRGADSSVRELVGWVRNVVPMNVYLDLENPRGSGFG